MMGQSEPWRVRHNWGTKGFGFNRDILMDGERRKQRELHVKLPPAKDTQDKKKVGQEKKVLP